MEYLDSVLPMYVDYLGRFERQQGLVETPSDVMSMLLKNGVTDPGFLPNGELYVTGGSLVLRDNFKQTEAERFDLRRVNYPMAFESKNQSRGQKSGFTRVVIFREESAGFNGGPLFHALQCLDFNPKELVQMIENATGASPSLGQHRQQHQALNRQDSLDNNWLTNGADGNYSDHLIEPIQRSPSPLGQRVIFPDRPRRQYDMAESLVEKNTVLLNLCIDDIEAFCANVRAVKERETERQVLAEALRATDFTQIFKKFKLAFNLLQKSTIDRIKIFLGPQVLAPAVLDEGFLDGRISDPDATDLVHHLFLPLAFLIDVCFEQFGDDLVKDILSPIPTKKAVKLLNNNLNNREMAIWKALGDYWRLTKDSFASSFPAYRPTFDGGWSPGAITFPEEEDEAAIVRSNSDRSKKTSGSSHDSSRGGPSGRDEFRDELMAKGARIALVTHTRLRQNPRELTVQKGEYLHVLDDARNWWRCKNQEGEVGFVPNSLVKAILYSDKFDAQSDNIYEGHRASRKSKKGRPVSPSTSEDDDYYRSNQRRERSASPTPSIPPPAPPVPAVLPETLRKNRHKMGLDHEYPAEIRPSYKSATMRSTDSMQEELKTVLSVYREREKEKLNIRTTPDIYITQKSTPTEVRNWLKAKQFGDRVINETAGMNGAKLFTMSRKDLIAVFGRDEGGRLDGQITISRNTSNYKTARTSELKQILEKARLRTESQKQEEEDEEENDNDQGHSTA